MRITSRELYEFTNNLKVRGYDVSLHGYNNGYRLCNRDGSVNLSNFYDKPHEMYTFLQGFLLGADQECRINTNCT